MKKEQTIRKIRIHFGNMKNFSKVLGVCPSSVYRYVSESTKTPKYYDFIFDIMDENKQLKKDLTITKNNI